MCACTFDVHVHICAHVSDSDVCRCMSAYTGVMLLSVVYACSVCTCLAYVHCVVCMCLCILVFDCMCMYDLQVVCVDT